ncbi:MAG: DNA cytosine methyltransferase [Pseudomonadota bacterium]
MEGSEALTNWFSERSPGGNGDELIIDSFAGGGGASTGIEMALGRSPDYAINHDAQALAMHARNHPETVHLSKNIWQVDPMEVVAGRPVGLLWASPDCKHFSKAKGGRPVKRNIRDLGWTVVLWARRARPRVIILENVEEFQDWGPVSEDGKPCQDRKGQTFKAWVRDLRRLGYRVQWRELRACDYGAPTIRKRLFVIARRDGRPIVWPKPTHGDPSIPSFAAANLKPWRTAAEIIDWSLPCPSIFDTAEEIMEKHGLRAKRPLADATLRRIARGVQRYVLDAPRPFVVQVAHGDSGGRRTYAPDAPMGTQTANRGDHAVVIPSIAYAQHGGGNRSAGEPLHTITASGKDQNQIIAPTLIQTGQCERQGQAPRVPGLDKPIGTQVAAGGRHAVVSAFLAQHNTGLVGHSPVEPVSTIVGKGCTQGVVAAQLTSFYGDGAGGKNRARDPRDPLATDTSGGNRHGVVAASMVTLRGSDRRDAAADEPLRTISAGGSHAGLIAAFLQKYYGTDQAPELSEPMHTDTTKPRFGLVTVEIAGTTYEIADIGMRMLSPRERFRAQGFPDRYQIETGTGPDGEPVKLTLEAQGRMCGNSVCPPLAAALVTANVPELARKAVAA